LLASQEALRGYFRSREAVYRALGKQNYMINPKRCQCPFISKEKRSKCKEHMSGTVELNRLNDLSNFIQHLLKQRSDNPAAKIAAARLKTAVTYSKITSEELDTREGTIDWEGTEDDGFEEIRPITDQGDAFEPSFELDTDEHAQWVRNAIAEFE
jgi:hypothetical protein